MDTGSSEIQSQWGGAQVVDAYPLSWVPYLRLALGFLIGFVLATLAGTLIFQIFHETFAGREWVALVAAHLVNLARTVYRWLYLRSVQLVIDDHGVWVEQGVLPWDKQLAGVKWVDISEAGYMTGFVSWAARSFTVNVLNRFSRDPEIVLRHVKGGDVAVSRINQVLMRLHRVA